MPSPLDFRKFGPLLWYMTTAPLGALERDPTPPFDPSRHFDAWAELTAEEQSEFMAMTSRMKLQLQNLKMAQFLFTQILSDAQLWTTDHGLVHSQVVKVAKLASAHFRELTEDARKREGQYDSEARKPEAKQDS